MVAALQHVMAAARGLATLPWTLWQERRRWGRGAPLSVGARVYYGMEDLPGADTPVSGGIVKCVDLATRFPNTPANPNILYLVSSALPSAPAWTIRAAQRAGAQVVLNQNGVAYPAWHGLGWKRTNRANSWVRQHADYVVYQSAFCREGAERFLAPADVPGMVLHNPVDTGVFTPASAASCDATAPVLLVAGSHHSAARVHTAIEALALLRAGAAPGARLIVAGRLCWRAAGAAEEVRQWAADAGVSDAVDWRGPYSQSQAPALMREAYMLLHLKCSDPCPRLVVEAMACGLPVVYSASGGVPELVPSTAGVGIASRATWEDDDLPTAEAVAQAVCELLPRWDAVSDAARLHAQQELDVQGWVAAHAALFEDLLKGTDTCPHA